MLASNLNWSWTMVSLIHKSLINQLCLVGQVNLPWLTNFSDFLTYLLSTSGYWKWSQLLSTEFPKSLVSDSKSRVSLSETHIGLGSRVNQTRSYGSCSNRLGIGYYNRFKLMESQTEIDAQPMEVLCITSNNWIHIHSGCIPVGWKNIPRFEAS